MMRRFHTLVPSAFGRRLALATVSSGAIWVAGTAATFGVGVVLARGLGPAGYGVYGTAIAVATLLVVPAQLGLPLLAIREVSATRVRGRPQDVAALGWWFVATVMIVSLAIAAALRLVAAALPLAPALRPALAAAAWLVPALALSGLTAGLLRGQERVVASQLLDVLVRPLLFVLALLAWAHRLDPAAAIIAQLAAAAAIALIGLTLFFRRLPLVPRGGERHLRAWTAAALPMTLLEAMRALEGSYAVLVAGYMASIADAGLLRVALACSVAATLPNSLLTIVVAPFLAAAHAAGERQRLARLVASGTLFMTASVLAITVVIAVTGRWLLPFAFGHAFAGAYWPLLVFCANQLLAASLGPGVILLSMTGHERTVARAFALSTAAAVIAALLLTPDFGAMGTAASALVATALRGALLNARARQLLGLTPSLLGAVALVGGGPAAPALGRHGKPR